MSQPIPSRRAVLWGAGVSVPMLGAFGTTAAAQDQELTMACRRWEAATAEVARRAALADAYRGPDRQLSNRLFDSMSQAQAVQFEIMDAVAEMPPATIAGVVAKARVALAAFNEDVPEEDRAATQRLVGIVLEELVQLGGGAA